ncbi:hypothetical protein IEQ34_015309 [Dendrobium chrysotoxum]|uniref:RING-type domain-containing protein n=1 Tax=Dendrobium chrysotoxum TaxID=161865 RepID=A0AAV7GGB8_DENCH|nr:hypothetical protein IEQ34_015309 [Dendrobium chrysotoxum]
MATTSSSSSSNEGVSILKSDGFHGFGYGMAAAMGIFLLITAVTLIIYYFLRWRNKTIRAYEHQSNVVVEAELADVEQGIDEITLKSFPKVIYGEDEVGSTTNDAFCSICLLDYTDAQILRLLPDCRHIFHAGISFLLNLIMATTSSSSTTEGVSILKSDGFHGFGYGMVVAMGIFLLITAVTLIIYYFLRWRNRTIRAYEHQSDAVVVAELANVEQGIDETTLKSFPKVIYGEDEVGSTTNDALCSICLLDYTDAQILRLLPDCRHIFHVGCVDEWPRQHPTCPICRCTPIRSISMPPLLGS